MFRNAVGNTTGKKKFQLYYNKPYCFFAFFRQSAKEVKRFASRYRQKGAGRTSFGDPDYVVKTRWTGTYRRAHGARGGLSLSRTVLGRVAELNKWKIKLGKS